MNRTDVWLVSSFTTNGRFSIQIQKQAQFAGSDLAPEASGWAGEEPSPLLVLVLLQAPEGREVTCTVGWGWGGGGGPRMSGKTLNSQPVFSTRPATDSKTTTNSRVGNHINQWKVKIFKSEQSPPPPSPLLHCRSPPLPRSSKYLQKDNVYEKEEDKEMCFVATVSIAEIYLI